MKKAITDCPILYVIPISCSIENHRKHTVLREIAGKNLIYIKEDVLHGCNCIHGSDFLHSLYNQYMNEITLRDQAKIDASLRVFYMLQDNPRMSQAKACANVGIDPKTYRKWIATQEDALEVVEEAKRKGERIQFSTYLTAKCAIVDSFVTDAIKPGVSITERIKALEHIEKRIDELSDLYHVVDVEAEQDLLSGPNQKPGISKMANQVIVEDEQ